ncbi:MAG: radical SAM protein [Halomonadaceae bacterium]|nr:MAG: radical SAM protein [Halomonadaceae bacterium]
MSQYEPLSDEAIRQRAPRILLVDLNNEATFPTLAIGSLATPLLKAGYQIEVFSPLAYGITALSRDVEETLLNYVLTRVHFAASPLIEWANEWLLQLYYRVRFRSTRAMADAFQKVLDETAFDAILVSSYLQYHQLLITLAGQAKGANIPLLLGGPYFNQKSVTEQWIDIPGVTAIFGGEADFVLPDIVRDMVQGRDLKHHPGVFKREITVLGQAAPPAMLTDDLPIPNFDHFAWDKHPHRLIPIMAGRGCGWGHCLFCSDVTTASTRTFRSRSMASVLREIQVQSERYQSGNFIFFDSKLNSDLAMWYGLIEQFQAVVPGARWVASVHVDGKGENGLDRESLKAAYAAGLRRISFGLESGSQRLNQLMRKGTSVERMSAFVRDAHEAGISVRTTIIVGYPGETAADLDATIGFIEAHRQYFDRVKLSKFKAIPGTGFDQRLASKPHKYPSVTRFQWDYLLARARFVFRPPQLRQYRRSKARLIKLVHRINRKSLMDEAQQFNGVM